MDSFGVWMSAFTRIPSAGNDTKFIVGIDLGASDLVAQERSLRRHAFWITFSIALLCSLTTYLLVRRDLGSSLLACPRMPSNAWSMQTYANGTGTCHRMNLAT